MFMKLFVFLILIYSSLSVLGQGTKPDSYLKKRIDSLLSLLDKNNSVEESVELNHRIQKLCLSVDYPTASVLSSVSLGKKLFEFGRYNKVLELADQNVETALKLNNPMLLSRLFAMKGVSYTKLGFLKEARIAMDQAASFGEKIPNADESHAHIGISYSNIAQILQESKNSSDSILFYLSQSVKEFQLVSNKSELKSGGIIALNNLGLFYLSINKCDSAEKYILLANHLSNHYDESKFIRIKIQTIQNLGTLYFKKKEYQKAINAYENALKMALFSKMTEQKKSIYEGMSEVYGAMKNKEMENVFLRKYSMLADSLNEEDKLQIKEIALLKPEEEIRLSTVNMILVIFIGGSIFLIFFLLRKQTQFVKKTYLEENDNTKLVAEQGDSEILNEIINLAKKNDPTFLPKFKAFSPTFIDKLLSITPDLLVSELEICVLLRLNFETKEIARYGNFSVKAVQGKKHRIRKKLKITSREDLHLWMTNL